MREVFRVSGTLGSDEPKSDLACGPYGLPLATIEKREGAVVAYRNALRCPSTKCNALASNPVVYNQWNTAGQICPPILKNGLAPDSSPIDLSRLSVGDENRRIY
jgi:hypothetical protein